MIFAYQSKLIFFFSWLVNLAAGFVLPIFNKSQFLKSLTQGKLRLFVILFFVASLMLAPGEGIKLAEFPLRELVRTSILDEKAFTIPFLSIPVLLLIPLLLVFLAQVKAKQIPKLWGFEILFVVFLVLAQMSVLTSTNVQASTVWFIKILFGVTIYIVFSRLFLRKGDLKGILYVLVGVAVLNISIATFQSVKGGLIGLPFEEVRTISTTGKTLSFKKTSQIRAVGLLSGPNRLSSYLAFLLPISVILAFHKKTIIRVAAHAVIAGSILASVLAMSRWGVASCIFAFVLTLFLIKFFSKIHLRQVLTVFKLQFLLLVGFAVVLTTNQVAWSRFSSFSTEDKSFSTRIELVVQSLYMIRENPVWGTGGGTFSTYFINNDVTPSLTSERFPAPVHNIYLLLASELGIPALVAFLLSVFGLAMFVFYRSKKVSFERRLIPIALCAAVFTFLFSGVWGTSSIDARLGFFLFLVSGLLVNILTSKPRQLPVAEFS